ncbi:hypothetical protein [Methanobrevibacter filiformis]|uniref:hypothetical protein n=1 Tax=Methanobrevibacter filiformis TaxID=55758 RepID=UPI000B0F22B1|nr:hypothetical protein [Methanobrevibacter filiformis]
MIKKTIHPDPENHPTQFTIQSKTVDKTYVRVIRHVDENKGLDINKLIKEL